MARSKLLLDREKMDNWQVTTQSRAGGSAYRFATWKSKEGLRMMLRRSRPPELYAACEVPSLLGRKENLVMPWGQTRLALDYLLDLWTSYGGHPYPLVSRLDVALPPGGRVCYEFQARSRGLVASNRAASSGLPKDQLNHPYGGKHERFQADRAF